MEYNINNIGEFFGTLQQSTIIIWQFHLKESNYDRHNILNDYYQNILDKVDELIEAWMSDNDKIIDYKNLINDDNLNVEDYLIKLKKFVEYGGKKFFKEDSELISLNDDILALIDSTLYKLEKLTDSKNNNTTENIQSNYSDLKNFLYENLI